MILSDRGHLRMEGTLATFIAEMLPIIDSLRRQVDDCPSEPAKEYLQKIISDAMVDTFFLGIDSMIGKIDLSVLLGGDDDGSEDDNAEGQE